MILSPRSAFGHAISRRGPGRGRTTCNAECLKAEWCSRRRPAIRRNGEGDELRVSSTGALLVAAAESGTCDNIERRLYVNGT